MTSLLTTDPAVLVLEDGSRHTGGPLWEKSSSPPA